MMDFTTYHKSLLTLFLAIATVATFSASTAGAKSTSVVSSILLAQDDVSVTSTDRQDTELQKKRMCLVGAAGGAVLGTILILFGYFRLNHATRGFYSGRLQTLAMVLIVVLLGLAMWFARQFGF